jgi:hypothetical protein
MSNIFGQTVITKSVQGVFQSFLIFFKQKDMTGIAMPNAVGLGHWF